MARKQRIEFPGALYHVITRGNQRQPIFRDDADREYYLLRLEHYRQRCAVCDRGAEVRGSGLSMDLQETAPMLNRTTRDWHARVSP